MEKVVERQTLILRLNGELDMKTSDGLKNAIDSEIERKGIRTVILNLQDVQFIDSSGLGVILGRFKKLLPLNGKLLITNAPTHIYKIMELAGMTKIITFYPEESMAREEQRKGNVK